MSVQDAASGELGSHADVAPYDSVFVSRETAMQGRERSRVGKPEDVVELLPPKLENLRSGDDFTHWRRKGWLRPISDELLWRVHLEAYFIAFWSRLSDVADEDDPLHPVVTG